MSRLGLATACVAGAALLGASSALAAPPLEAYGKLPAVEVMALSASGDRYAFVAVEGEGRKLVAAPVGGKALAVQDVGQVKITGLRLVGDRFVVVRTSATVDLRLDFGSKYELSSVVVVNLDKARDWGVFRNAEGVAQTVFGDYGAALVDGKWTGFFSTMTFERDRAEQYALTRNDPDLYAVDLDSGRFRLAARASELAMSWVVAPDGKIVARSDYAPNTGRWRLFAGEGTEKPLLEKDSPTNDIALDGLGRAPDTVLVVDQTGHEDVLEEVPVAGGAGQKLFSDLSLKQTLSDPVTGLLIGALTDEEPGAVFFDPQLQARYSGMRKAFPGLKVHLISYSRGLGRMIVRTDGAHDSGTYWFVDIADHSANPAGSERPDVSEKDVAETSLVQYKAADGLQIEGVLTLPPGREAKSLPLVVMPHGGPIGIRDDVGFHWWAQAFASRGYAVFQPNYRGSSGYGVEFRHAGMGEWGRKMLSDISDGVAALAAKGVIDPRRACIVGASYGGYAALAGVTVQHGLYRCAVSVAGVSNLVRMIAQENGDEVSTNDVSRFDRAATGADKLGDVGLRAISPASLAARADAPILLIHGKDDTVVPIEQSEMMASALKAAGKVVEFEKIPGQDHWMSTQATRIATVKASVEFVLKNDPPG